MKSKSINFLSSLFLTLIALGASAQHPIDSAFTIPINGIKQYVKIEGRDRSKPLLLFLHGGPGNSVMGYSAKFTNQLKEKFVVVQWDQRASGKTATLNPTEDSLTLGEFQSDTHALVAWLLSKYNQPKLYLVGHSWGTFLGFYMAKQYPELLYAYIAICPMVDQQTSERIILQKMKDNALEKNNEQEIEDLNSVHIPFENSDELFYHRKWLQVYMTGKSKLTKEYLAKWSTTWLSVFNEASKENLNLTAPELKCPVYFLVGRKDYQTNSMLTEKYYEQLVAPKKNIFWFENAGHSLPSSESAGMQQVIIDTIFPATYQ